MKLAAVFVFLMALGSCKKFAELPAPATQMTTEKVFSNDQTAAAAVTGLYEKIMLSFGYLNGFMSLYPGLCADELEKQTITPADQGFYEVSISPANSTVASIWSSGYRYINHANKILAGIEQSHGLTPEGRSQFAGEAKFMRALSYFYFVNLFGDVPLVLTADDPATATLPRAPVARIYQQIINDLLQASSLLSAEYMPISEYPSVRTRANRWAAKALLARVYLYTGQCADAEREADAVISAGPYQLAADPNEAFLPSSPEAILQFLPAGNSFNSAEGGLFCRPIPAPGRDANCPKAS